MGDNLSAPRFLIAKYVPDIRRMEPRNIGIILWSEAGVAARFVGESGEFPELVYYPSFIKAKNRPVYKDWITYWRLLLEKPALELPGVGTVSSESPQYVDALAHKSRENFLLVDGGVLLDRVVSGAIQESMDELFMQLVAGDELGQEVREFERLQIGWRRFAHRAHLVNNPLVHHGKSIPGTVGGIEREYRFTAVVGNGKPEGVIQKVIASNAQSVNSASFMFEAVRKQNHWKQNRCAAVVHAPDGQQHDNEVRLAIDQLRTLSTLLNVAYPKKAITDLKGMDLPIATDH